ncbi:MAG: 50S ribosomal protein L25/general stress protein Ctc [Synechococcales bacterium]|nr:50S ribosomal protein L25/general stress protein Ctc [Synechococcales bacterium]
MELTIECNKRSPDTKAKALRREGRIPAVLYGHDGAESVSLTMDAKEAETLLRHAAVNSSLIQLNVPDMPWRGRVLIREAHLHPWRGYLYHLSFFSVKGQDTVDVTIPFNIVGEAVGVKEERGILQTVLTELPAKCEPAAIPESIEIDITSLKVGDNLHVSDLSLPQGVTPNIEPERTVLSIQPPATVQAEPAEEAPTDPAVLEALSLMDAGTEAVEAEAGGE